MMNSSFLNEYQGKVSDYFWLKSYFSIKYMDFCVFSGFFYMSLGIYFGLFLIILFMEMEKGKQYVKLCLGRDWLTLCILWRTRPVAIAKLFSSGVVWLKRIDRRCSVAWVWVFSFFDEQEVPLHSKYGWL